MGLDIKLPIGLMFTIFGILLAIYGFATSGSEIYVKSLQININLWSGLFMLVFGIFMLLMAKFKKE